MEVEGEFLCVVEPFAVLRGCALVWFEGMRICFKTQGKE